MESQSWVERIALPLLSISSASSKTSILMARVLKLRRRIISVRFHFVRWKGSDSKRAYTALSPSVHFAGRTGTSPAANRDWCLVREKSTPKSRCMPYNHGHISAIQLREHELQGSSQNLTCGRLFGNCTQVNQSPTATAAGCEKCKVLPELCGNRVSKSASCSKEHIALCNSFILS